MTPNFRSDLRGTNAKLIKDMIQMVVSDLYKFSLETQKKLDSIVEIVETSFDRPITVNREVQTDELPYLKTKISVRQDLFESNNSQDLLTEEHGIFEKQKEPPDDYQAQAEVVRLTNAENTIEEPIAVHNMKIKESTEMQEEPIANDLNQLNGQSSTFMHNNNLQDFLSVATTNSYSNFEQPEQRETVTQLNNNQPITAINNHIQDSLREMRSNGCSSFEQIEKTENVAQSNNNQLITGKDIPVLTIKDDNSEDSNDSSSSDSNSSDSNSSDSNSSDSGSQSSLVSSDSSKSFNGSSSQDSVCLVEESNGLEWLLTVHLQKSPYFPQLGDEVVYIQQGHQDFFQYVKSKKLCDIHEADMPWRKFNLKAHEFARVKEISFKVKKHTRICCLKLGRNNEGSKQFYVDFFVDYFCTTGDEGRPCDFLILRQHFDATKNWQIGSRFRRMIENVWYFGKILSEQSLDPKKFPDSKYKCLTVESDNGMEYNVSPWDIEPIDEENLPRKKGSCVPVTQEENLKLYYNPKPIEWRHCSRADICHRIHCLLEKLMEDGLAEPFIKLSNYSPYVTKVEYPIDLTIIKFRVKNLFYRRLEALEFDIGSLVKNVKQNHIDFEFAKHKCFTTYEHQITHIRILIISTIREITQSASPVLYVKEDVAYPPLFDTPKRRKNVQNSTSQTFNYKETDSTAINDDEARTTLDDRLYEMFNLPPDLSTR